MNYTGGKGGSGVYQQIINLMPRHEIYIETHLGGGNILLRKRPARLTIAIEIDTRALQEFQKSLSRDRTHVLDGALSSSAVTFVNGDCIPFLRQYQWTGAELIYSDPPYLMSVRRSQKRCYRYEWNDADHVTLISILKEVPAFVMISGYPSAMYDDALSSWHTHTFRTSTRRGIAIEKLWMNFDPATVLKHEYTYAGENYRERERIKRKAARWVSNLAVLPGGERNFILQEISKAFTTEFHHHSSIMAVPAESSDMAVPAAMSEN